MTMENPLNALVMQLKILLEQEQAALAHNDQTSLLELAEQKTALTQSIEKQATLTALDEQTQRLLQECEAINTINGAVIQVNLHNLKQVNNAIKGVDCNQNTYGSRGQVQQGYNKRQNLKA